ncbi:MULTISPECIES: biotin transporter BioY [unclassified Janibacter]|uniref:biotin transporter BioY n=1 Tax=unclassified Janibacter TaxID=2649294 RepID=UPI003D030E5F
MTTAIDTRPQVRVLADVVPGGLVRDAGLVLGGAAVMGALAQIAIPLGFTPIPLSLGTLTALLVGSALGPLRGVLSVGLYLLAGVAGVPWFAENGSGWQFASFGYIIGFVLAAGLVGALARRGTDRRVGSTIGAMVLGNLAIYAIGVPWLMSFAGVGFTQALALGVTPFLLGDALKIAIAAGVLPSAWKLVDRVER